MIVYLAGLKFEDFVASGHLTTSPLLLTRFRIGNPLTLPFQPSSIIQENGALRVSLLRSL
jgi:hypothetical protein